MDAPDEVSALETYHQRQMATNWGPSIAGLDLNHISTYVSPKTQQANSWDDVPEDIRDTFDRLGIPQAEAESLAGVGAQYDSEIVYHNMREEVAEQGVIYTTIEDALHDPQWEPVVKEYFGKLIPPTDHKFAALHYLPCGLAVLLFMCQKTSLWTTHFRAILD